MIKSESVVKKEEVVSNYPYLALCIDPSSAGELVVLFDKENCGTVVKSYPDGYWKIGQHSNVFSESKYFVPYTGSITLTNI